MNARHKPVFAVVLALCFILAAALSAEEPGTGRDIDSLFDSPSENDTQAPPPLENGEGDKLDLLQQLILSRGFSIEADYNMRAFVAPGSTEAPWVEDTDEFPREITTNPGLQMSANLGLDIQLSEVLRVQQSIMFQILDPDVKVKEFFFDYNIAQKVFVRMGLYDLNWGQSHNFQFTNLLARIPEHYPADKGNDSKLIKITVPVGIGGFEGVLSGRFVDDFSSVALKAFGYGLKYNIIRPRVDMDIGVFYHRLMPLRGFFSLQTTLLKSTEFYMEGLAASPHDGLLDPESGDEHLTFYKVNAEDIRLSGALGVIQTFFNDKLVLNAEIFYSGESDAEALDTDELAILTNEEKRVEILHGLNTAFNARYQPGGPIGLGLGLSFRWAFADVSGQIIPAVYLSPVKHITLSVAVPMALGNRTAPGSDKPAYYYTNNPDGSGRPFSVIFAMSMNSNYRFGYYE